MNLEGPWSSGVCQCKSKKIRRELEKWFLLQGE